MSIITVICTIALIVVIALRIGRSEKRQVGKFTVEHFVQNGYPCAVLIKSKKQSGVVTLPQNINTIGYRAFMNMKEITNIVIPEKVDTIGRECFKGCEELKEVYLGEGTKIVCEEAFYGCVGLTNIKLGPNIEKIESKAFAKCDNIASIHVEGITIPKVFTSSFEDKVKEKSIIYVPNNTLELWQKTPIWSQFKNIKGY